MFTISARYKIIHTVIFITLTRLLSDTLITKNINEIENVLINILKYEIQYLIVLVHLIHEVGI